MSLILSSAGNCYSDSVQPISGQTSRGIEVTRKGILRSNSWNYSNSLERRHIIIQDIGMRERQIRPQYGRSDIAQPRSAVSPVLATFTA